MWAKYLKSKDYNEVIDYSELVELNDNDIISYELHNNNIDYRAKDFDNKLYYNPYNCELYEQLDSGELVRVAENIIVYNENMEEVY